jgi:hypothetical protein
MRACPTAAKLANLLHILLIFGSCQYPRSEFYVEKLRTHNNRRRWPAKQL